MIDPTFWNINRLFILSFKDGEDDVRQDIFLMSIKSHW